MRTVLAAALVLSTVAPAAEPPCACGGGGALDALRWLGFATVASFRGDRPAAMRAWRAARDHERAGADGLTLVAEDLARSGDRRGAILAYEQAARVAPRPLYLTNLGHAYAEQ